jgi:hypothetical protein
MKWVDSCLLRSSFGTKTNGRVMKVGGTIPVRRFCGKCVPVEDVK